MAEQTKQQNRKLAIGCLIVFASVFLLLFFAIMIGDGEDRAGNAAGPSDPAPTVATPEGGAMELTKEQDRAVDFLRGVVMQTLSCKGEMENTQSRIDKMVSAGLHPIEAYEAAKIGVRDCGKAIGEFENGEWAEAVPSAQRHLAMRALTECKAAAQSRKAAMELAQIVLDGDDTLKNSSRYRELRNNAVSEEVTCRMTLLGIAENMGIPESEVDFAQL